MLTPDEGEALFAPLSAAPALLLAISGGPDSMALLDLAVRWRAARPSGPALFAATVDHGLRPESAAEAEMAGAFARKLAVPHTTLPWTGDKPAARLQERARDARYALLRAHAASIGAGVIVTAHHADDQAETVLMRLTRGSSIAGLAGMKPLTAREGVALARPLLGVAKGRLVAHCEAAGVPFVRDPSNEDERFGRVRARRIAAVLAGEGLDASGWARLASRAARAEDALAAAAAQACAAFAAGRSQGAFCAPMADIAELPEEFALRLVGAEAARVGAGAPPRLERLEAACRRLLEAHRTRAAITLTLAGARIRLTRAGVLEITPEGPRRRGVASQAPSVHVSGSNTASDAVAWGASLGNGGQRA